MLILERRVGSSIRIGDDVRVTVRAVRGRDGVKLAIKAPRDLPIVREEVFGPVMVAIPFESEAEVIAMANDTHYGLAAFIFTHDVSRITRLTRTIDAGWIQVNQGGGQIPGMSYGGTKQSGTGSEYSIEGALEAYTYRKCVTINVEPAG